MSRPKRSNAVPAFSLVEAVVSIAIVSVMLVAALNTVGATRTGQYKIAERSQGLLLAQELLAEILQHGYTDPEDGVDSLKLPGEKVGDGSRILWKDVDDFDGWSASPPKRTDGTEMSDLQEWERSVEVVWVDPWNLSQTVGENRGVKRITVTVTHNGKPVASLFAFRTNKWINIETDPRATFRWVN